MIHQQITPYNRLAELFDFLSEWDIAPLTETANSSILYQVHWIT
jgi:hypothetical protein